MKKSEKAANKDVAPKVEPIFGNPTEQLLGLGAIVTVALVAMLFQLDVNRVFDVPKAVVLKIGGCGLFLIWLLTGLFGKGYAWKSIRLFAAPVFALTAAVAISTLLSFDFATSLNGVYERQFGLQGFLGCVGLFVVTATCLRSKRGAMFALGCLAIIGGAVGTYALLQAYGYDPYPFFFHKPHTKVYSYLGNATFAGNSLALIAPISAIVALVAIGTSWSKSHKAGETGTAVGVTVTSMVAMLVLQMVPAWWASGVATMTSDRRESVFKFGLGASFAIITALAAVGSHGIKSLQFETRKSQRIADAGVAGALAAAFIGIVIGLIFTRTRGAWVGSFVALGGGFILLPNLFKGWASFKMIRAGCWGSLVLVVMTFALYIGFAESICKDPKGRCLLVARTIRSIPAAFDPNRTDYGKGQGTRRFLWTESPRVLINHGATLDRVYADRAEQAAATKNIEELDVGLEPIEPLTPDEIKASKSWRSAAVWMFGIGIETYRYAFMSHKSKRLEALDPMTNHDNPHNNYLYVLASFGIAGLAAYLWLLFRLLTQAYRRFSLTPRRLIIGRGRKHRGDLVREWSFDEQADPPRLYLDGDDPKIIADSIKASTMTAKVRIENERVVLTHFTASAVMDELAEVHVQNESSIVDQAIAFGVVTSFFSYAVYSIAGFDSVACSVFLYFLLGCAAVYFEPSLHDTRRPIGVNIRRQWAAFRGRDPDDVPRTSPVALSLVLAALGVVLLSNGILGAVRSYRSERAFVGDRAQARSRMDLVRNKIASISEAVRINPTESYYKQNLGTAYGDAARIMVRQSQQLQRQGKSDEAAAFAAEGKKYTERSLLALYAALDHAWAPENIYISAFQLHYAVGQIDKAEQALERALEHSPHLGAVRANLAVLKLERGADDAAMKDARWVLEVDPRSAIAHRVVGQVLTKKGDFDGAERHLKLAKRYASKDRAIDRAIQLLEAARQAATSTS